MALMSAWDFERRTHDSSEHTPPQLKAAAPVDNVSSSCRICFHPWMLALSVIKSRCWTTTHFVRKEGDMKRSDQLHFPATPACLRSTKMEIWACWLGGALRRRLSTKFGSAELFYSPAVHDGSSINWQQRLGSRLIAGAWRRRSLYLSSGLY